MKNIIGEIGYLKVRRCTMVIDATDWKRGSNGEFIFHEARIVEIYYTAHPEVKIDLYILLVSFVLPLPGVKYNIFLLFELHRR